MLDDAAFSIANLADAEIFTTLPYVNDRWFDTITSSEEHFLGDLLRTMHDVHGYRLGAFLLRRYGIKLLKSSWVGIENAETRFRELFRISWIDKNTAANSPGLIWTKSPMTFIEETINAARDLHSKSRLNSTEKSVLAPPCSGLWTKGEQANGKVHVELKMASYIIRKGILPYLDVIGISEVPCFSCKEFLMGNKRHLFIREPSGTVIADWSIPKADWSPSAFRFLHRSMRKSAIITLETYLEDAKAGRTGDGAVRLISTKITDLDPMMILDHNMEFDINLH